MRFKTPAAADTMQEALKYKILKSISENPKTTQRQLADKLGISLGKTNYCLRAIIEKGWVKAENFRQSPHKSRYLYRLTPHGLEEKARVTARFLKIKLEEYENLKSEIRQLRKEASEE